MKDLIAKLEAAKEGSRWLDGEIWRAINPDRAFAFEGRPNYTTSLDVALTLVPADPANPGKLMLWSISYDEDGVGGARSYCAGLGKGYHDPQIIYGHSDATPALALCIASLRARLAANPRPLSRVS